MNISHAQISRIERGLQPYNQSSLQQFAEIYDCEPSDLLTLDPTKADDSETRENDKLFMETEKQSVFSSSASQNLSVSIRKRLEAAVNLNSGMTYRKLSLLAGLSDSLIHKFMTGATHSMSIDTLINVAEVLNVDSRWLIFGDTRLRDSLASTWEQISDSDKPRALAILRLFAEPPNLHNAKNDSR
jgi:transcriptional regulator with XRE-family HTH domain